MQKSKYLVVESSEIDLANKLQQPIRAYQGADIYPHLTFPRVFVEVTSRVKFKRDSMGNCKFVSSQLNLVHSEHKKGDENPGPKAGNLRTQRKNRKNGNGSDSSGS